MTTLTLRLPRTLFLLQNARPYPPISYQFQSSSSTLPLQRHASSSTNSSLSKSPPLESPSTINGPTSTLPAPLNAPQRSPDQALPKYLFSLGKAYATFYKTGVKNIYHNFRLSRPIQRLIDEKYHSSLTQAVSAGALTRSDFQLLARNWHDLKRIPVFALVFAICGEFTPLVVIAVSNVVPWTCRIPKQIQSDRKKLEARRAISFRNLTLPPPSDEAGGKILERMQLLHISWSLGLSSSAWDYLGGKLPGLPTFILRRKVHRRVEYLGMDDRLIREGGGVGNMDMEEVRMACVERGLDIVSRSDEAARADLEKWLKNREKVSVEHLLLTRPSVWPLGLGDLVGKEPKPHEHKKAYKGKGSKSEERKKVYV